MITKLLKPVDGTLCSQGHLNVGYIDDSYLQGSSMPDCSQNVRATICLFENLGFVINKEKSVLQPCQKLVFLDFILDSILMRVYLTPDKTDRVVSACQMLLNRSYVSIREVAQVIGLTVSSLPAVQYGALFYRNIEIDKNEAFHKNKGNFETLMQLSPESREDLSWWMRTLPQAYKQIDLSNPDIQVTTDASKIGWGTVSLGETTQGLWSESEQLSHINKLEILAVHFALRRFKSHIKEKAC